MLIRVGSFVFLFYSYRDNDVGDALCFLQICDLFALFDPLACHGVAVLHSHVCRSEPDVCKLAPWFAIRLAD
jgi:hypothetical protein